MVVINHKHDFAATNFGYLCTGCSASDTTETLRLNPGKDPSAVWQAVNAWNPTALPGLKFWLDASSNRLWTTSARTTSAVADTDTVGAWDDLTGNNNAIQATAGSRPVLKLNNMNGKPIVRFDGTASTLRAAGLTLVQPNDWYLVATNTAAGANDAVFFDGVSAHQKFYKAGPNAANTWSLTAGTVNTGLTADTSAHVFTVTVNGASSVFRVDGVAKALTAGDSGAAGLTGLDIGCAAAADFLPGDIAEFVAFNRVLTALERQTIERYLGSKWGIAVA